MCILCIGCSVIRGFRGLGTFTLLIRGDSCSSASYNSYFTGVKRIPRECVRLFIIHMKSFIVRHLAHVIMELGKSQDTQGELASWSVRKVDGLVPVQVQRSGNQRARGVVPAQTLTGSSPPNSRFFHLSLKAWKKLMSQPEESEARMISLTQRKARLFVLFRPSKDWLGPLHIRQGHLLYSSFHFRCYSLPKHPHQHTQNGVWLNI